MLTIVFSPLAAAYWQYNYLSKFFNYAGTNISEIALLTVNFNCTTHVDDNDKIELDDLDQRVEDLRYLSTSERLNESDRLHAEQTLKHVEHWNAFSFPTMCGYQNVVSKPTGADARDNELQSHHFQVDESDCNGAGDESSSKVEIYQWFCMPGIGMCCRIRNYWVHLFLGSCFSHYTSVAIFVKDGLYYFGKCPGISIFAWGKCRPKKKGNHYYQKVNGKRVKRSSRVYNQSRTEGEYV